MISSIQNKTDSDQEVFFYERLSYAERLHGIGGRQLYSVCQRGGIQGIYDGLAIQSDLSSFPDVKNMIECI